MVGLTCLYELCLQCELTIQMQLIGTSQPNHVHKVLPDLVLISDFFRICSNVQFIVNLENVQVTREAGTPETH